MFSGWSNVYNLGPPNICYKGQSKPEWRLLLSIIRYWPYTRLERLSWDKRSSIFGLFCQSWRKKSFIILIPGRCSSPLSLQIHHEPRNKLNILIRMMGGWVETNQSNIRKHPYLTSVSPSAQYHEAAINGCP